MQNKYDMHFLKNCNAIFEIIIVYYLTNITVLN